MSHGLSPIEVGVNSDYWLQVEDLYSSVAGLEPGERARVLNARRAHAPEIVTEVESLLAVDPPSNDFLVTPWVGAQPPDPDRLDLRGRTIGPFRLLEEIGSGGMGVVYRAERQEPGFEQRVAIKVITATRWHRGSLQQFKAERQLLASLHHPHIVTLIDGGLTDDGLAYLVMEYVEGSPITSFCRERRLDLRARLRLFQQVCRAVQYAHQRSIVHRDLKPGNILVTPDGVPKILDFGIARLVTDSSDATQTTAGSLRALTPAYASPDQIRGLPVSAADDVYALGVLLFELLAGRAPYDTSGKPLDEVLRLVLDARVPRLSDACSRDTAAVERNELAGDLDAIASKAMAKDSARRYGSAQELADDLGRHLSGQAVVAREPSLPYLLATLARRHRAAVAASVVSMLAVLAALGVSIVQTRRALAERDRADQRFSDVRRLANALIFDIHDSVVPLAGSTPVRERIVAEALTYLEVLARDTDDDALRLELGRAYLKVGTVQGNPTGPNLGDRDGAISSYQKAIALLTPLVPRSRDAAAVLTRVRFSMVATLNALGRREAALATAREARETIEPLIARDPADAEARRMLGTALFWQATMSPGGTGPGESIPAWHQAGEVFEALLAEQPDDRDRQRNVALVSKYLGEQYRRAGDLDNALIQHRRALDLDERRLARAPEDRQAQLDLALDWSSLAGLHREQGRLTEAAASYEQSLAVRTRLAAADPDDDYTRGRLAHAHAMLGEVYGALGRLDEGIDHLRDAVRLNQSRSQDDAESRLDLGRQLVLLAGMEREANLPGEGCEHARRAAHIDLAAENLAEPLLGTAGWIAEQLRTSLAFCVAGAR